MRETFLDINYPMIKARYMHEILSNKNYPITLVRCRNTANMLARCLNTANMKVVFGERSVGRKHAEQEMKTKCLS